MEIPHVVVFKLCNIFTFRSLVEELILKRKIDSQTGTKTEKLLLTLSVNVFTRYDGNAKKKSWSECERLSSCNDGDAYFCFCTELVDSVSANTSKLPQQIVLLTMLLLFCEYQAKGIWTQHWNWLWSCLPGQDSLQTKLALNLITSESFKELPLFFGLMLLRP